MNLKRIDCLVGGANGVGKTTLLKEIAAINPSYYYVHGTTMLMEKLGIHGNYAALRRDFTQEQREEAFAACVLELLREPGRTRHLILDAHYLNIVEGRVTRVTGDWIQYFDAYVLVTAPTVDILRRIDKDPDRDRALFPEDCEDRYAIIEAYQEAMRTEFAEIVRAMDAKNSNLVIHHLQQKTHKAVGQFLNFHQKLLALALVG